MRRRYVHPLFLAVFAGLDGNLDVDSRIRTVSWDSKRINDDLRNFAVVDPILFVTSAELPRV